MTIVAKQGINNMYGCFNLPYSQCIILYIVALHSVYYQHHHPMVLNIHVQGSMSKWVCAERASVAVIYVEELVLEEEVPEPVNQKTDVTEKRVSCCPETFC